MKKRICAWTLTDIITGGVRPPFDSYYESARAFFKKGGHFYALSATTCKGLHWPSNPGVYVVCHVGNPEEVLYIGMTGKFSQAGQMSAGQGLKGRAGRWTPYRFDTETATFCYGPKYAKGEKRTEGPPKAGYSHSIPIANIRVDCFEYYTTHRMAPAFLESLFLQGYLMQYGRLPVANNEL